MTVDVSPLYASFQVNGLTLPNRLVMAPMTRAKSPGGIPTDEVAAYYRRRAEGGTGLLISEGTVIDRPLSRNNADLPSIHGDGLAGWRKVLAEVHDAGGRMWSQLWHVGALPDPRAPDWPNNFEGPSGLTAPDQPLGHAMTESDIADTIASFARAAADAKAVGFDGIELHAAHGYLIDQFFWAGTNRRDDRWGGPTLAERARFAVEIVQAVRSAIPADMPLGMRVSQYKIQDYDTLLVSSPSEVTDWLGPLADAGVDIFHCSQRNFTAPAFPGSDLNLAGWAKKATGKPSITVGSIGLEESFYGDTAEAGAPTLRELVERLERDEFDLVAIGRAILSEPQISEKVREGRFGEIAPFTREAILELR
ncbi:MULTISPECIES: NADH:flavin oxidoreductase [unclassified Sphingobium]|uniref:NADH:flavin oxidoreductase n=1 Tax=unclassified Sphingobium TaxID=2611147 RepID=UPI0022257F67|nr:MULTISPECIES: NADH:flavin oxidoreductase [unclassified Sphingobium]MCW2351678.1 2,4-dienoyl-CoA reductase-like NADH-dependent reductase (Old Yellow Enzyme family) [Sphingobium sp. B12D2B]MCW2370945.1 2,4-dienoyl-CoA reductase-like NADH-dependent reductase (Old Yellow Enzyme family) [Sphingobium sp. B11D3D]